MDDAPNFNCCSTAEISDVQFANAELGLDEWSFRSMLDHEIEN